MDTDLDSSALTKAAEKGGVVAIKSNAANGKGKRKSSAKDIYEQEISAVTKKRKRSKGAQ